MNCESCKTEIIGDQCPKCGLKVKKARCVHCLKKFYASSLNNNLCPECYEIEKYTGYKSPLIAVVLSVVPGLGHNYLGLQAKGGTFLLMFLFSLIVPVIGWIMIPVAYFLPMWDAYRTAIRINEFVEINPMEE